MENLIRLEHVSKTYQTRSSVSVPALRDISVTVGQGEILAIVGVSGSGKSTLLHIMGLVDNPDEGSIYICGVIPDKSKQTFLARHRNRNIGFVMQDFALIPSLTVKENIELPLKYSRMKRSDKNLRCRAIISEMKLDDLSGRMISELSGGQKQRVAIARALANDPPLILADEPTGSIDSAAKKEILALFLELKKQGKTIVLVTHDVEVSNMADRVLHIKDGKII